MTITYSQRVSDVSACGPFLNILPILDGSVYELVWREYIVFLSAFLVIHALNYNFPTNAFAKVRDACYRYKNTDTLPFLLGIFVSQVVFRWWSANRSLPSMDVLASYASVCVSGDCERSRLTRRIVVRYALASYVLTLRRISLRVMNRFPTTASLTGAGLLVRDEQALVERAEGLSVDASCLLPLAWAVLVVNRAELEGRIDNELMKDALVKELARLRATLCELLGYDLVNIPLGYTQVVTVAFYAHSLCVLLGYQRAAADERVDAALIYALVCASLEFTFFLGYLKIAEILINPFGEDKEDFEIIKSIERHRAVAYMIVDDVRKEQAELEKAILYDPGNPETVFLSTGGSPQAKRLERVESAVYSNVPSTSKEEGHLTFEQYKDMEYRRNLRFDHLKFRTDTQDGSSTGSSEGIREPEDPADSYNAPSTTRGTRQRDLCFDNLSYRRDVYSKGSWQEISGPVESADYYNVPPTLQEPEYINQEEIEEYRRCTGYDNQSFELDRHSQSSSYEISEPVETADYYNIPSTLKEPEYLNKEEIEKYRRRTSYYNPFLRRYTQSESSSEGVSEPAELVDYCNVPFTPKEPEYINKKEVEKY